MCRPDAGEIASGVQLASIRPMPATGSLLQVKAFVRSNPIRWLVLGGAFLIAAITIGTTIMASNFRERAL